MAPALAPGPARRRARGGGARGGPAPAVPLRRAADFCPALGLFYARAPADGAGRPAGCRRLFRARLPGAGPTCAAALDRRLQRPVGLSPPGGRRRPAPGGRGRGFGHPAPVVRLRARPRRSAGAAQRGRRRFPFGLGVPGRGGVGDGGAGERRGGGRGRGDDAGGSGVVAGALERVGGTGRAGRRRAGRPLCPSPGVPLPGPGGVCGVHPDGAGADALLRPGPPAGGLRARGRRGALAALAWWSSGHGGGVRDVLALPPGRRGHPGPGPAGATRAGRGAPALRLPRLADRPGAPGDRRRGAAVDRGRRGDERDAHAQPAGLVAGAGEPLRHPAGGGAPGLAGALGAGLLTGRPALGGGRAGGPGAAPLPVPDPPGGGAHAAGERRRRRPPGA